MTSTRPLLLLHAGTHKTGTTAIQQYASRHRKSLRRAGFLYPDLSREFPNRFPRSDLVFSSSQQHFFHALAGDCRFIDLARCQNQVVTWASQCNTQRCGLFISAEAICRHLSADEELSNSERNLQYLIAVNNLFSAHFDILPILVFRRPDDFARSLYQERIMRGQLRDYISLEEFIDLRRDKFDYLAVTRRFEKAFGRLKVLTYEDLSSGGDLCCQFFHKIGIPILANSSKTEDLTARSSLSPPQTLLKLRLNSMLPQFAPMAHPQERATQHTANQVVLKWLKSEAVTYALRNSYPNSSYSFWPNGTQDRHQFMNSLRPSLDVFLNQYDLSFPPIVTGHEPAYIEPFEIEKMTLFLASLALYRKSSKMGSLAWIFSVGNKFFKICFSKFLS